MLRIGPYLAAGLLAATTIGCAGNSDQNGVQFVGAYNGFWSPTTGGQTGTDFEPIALTVRSDGNILGTFQNSTGAVGSATGKVDRVGNLQLTITFGAGVPTDRVAAQIQVGGAVDLKLENSSGTVLSEITSTSSLAGDGTIAVGASAPTPLHLIFGKD